MPSIINSDDGVVSGTSGLKTTGGNDGLLNIQSNGSTVVAVTGSGISVTGTVSQTGVSTFAAGTVSAPSITFTGDTNTGIFSPAADTIAFTEGGVESMRIDSSGNVLISSTSNATASPTFFVKQKSGTVATIGGFNFYATTTSADSNNNGILSGAYYNGSNVIATQTTASIYQQYDGAHIWYTNTGLTIGNTVSSTERMRIDSSGNVGIGTSSPSSFGKLCSVGTNTSSALLAVRDEGTSTGNLFIVSTNNAGTIARINANGIGIGGATPSSGMGITFPATISASSNANTLDDYEEGTWTVSVIGATTAGTTTYGDSRTGWYRKIGSQVTVWYYVNVLSATGSGPIQIGPLPFTLNSSNIQSAGSVMTNNFNWGTNLGSLTSYAGTNHQYLYIYVSSDDAGWTAQSIINEQFDLIGTHTYFTGD